MKFDKINDVSFPFLQSSHKNRHLLVAMNSYISHIGLQVPSLQYEHVELFLKMLSSNYYLIQLILGLEDF